MQLGNQTRTPRSRYLNQKAYQHLHRAIPGGAMPEGGMDQLTL